MKKYSLTFSLLSTIIFAYSDTDGIRLYQPHDLPYLREAIATNSDLLLPADTLEKQIELTVKFFGSKKYTTAVFIKDNKVVGFITYQKVFINRFIAWLSGYQGSIQLLSVSEDYRRQGIGAALLTYALQDLQQKGFKKIILMTKIANNASRALYEKHGFKLKYPHLMVDDCLYEYHLPISKD